MIERLYPRLVAFPGNPPMLVNEAASLPCGCRVLVGLRLDILEAATMAMPCSGSHVSLMERFNELLRDSLSAPRSQPLVEVCEELLASAAGPLC